MESYFQLIPNELIDLTFEYLTNVNIYNFQEYLLDIGVNLNWEIVFSNKFNIEYQRIRKVLVHDKSLGRLINWSKHYLDFVTILENRDNIFEKTISVIMYIELAYVDYSTLNLVYYSIIFDKYPNCYYMKKYFQTDKLKSYIIPYVLEDALDVLKDRIDDIDIKILLKSGYLESKVEYNSDVFQDTSAKDLIILLYILSFDNNFSIDIDDITIILNDYNNWKKDYVGDISHPIILYYDKIYHILYKKYNLYHNI